LAEKGFSATRALLDDELVESYPETVYDHLDEEEIPGRRVSKSERFSVKEQDKKPDISVLSWLNKVLVNPKSIQNIQQRNKIILAQNCLVKSLNGGTPPSIDEREKVQGQIDSMKEEVPESIRQVIEAKGLSLVELVVAAHHARQNWLEVAK
jgi:hypothetical protein